MSQLGTVALYTLSHGRTGEFVGAGSLVAGDVVIVHAPSAAVRTRRRLRVQILDHVPHSGESKSQVIDGRIRRVEEGIVFVELDARARSAVVQIPGSAKALDAASWSTRVREFAGQPVDGAATPPRPPSTVLRVPGPGWPGGGDDDDDPPCAAPWCHVKPRWPGCKNYKA
ncbi:MAG: hypothetical protein L0H41_10285 [Microlunatus sp.]|nr:hypothetical protein [Microlunatus sp.]MDN5769693.1 hypothetical protein [Microlunatus sp.]MDN5803333.1 hypothetical protein [Microlunatus sp.]